MKKEDKPKINLKDIIDGKEMRETATFTANGVKYWADRITKDEIATHADCVDCGVEFKKEYTYDKRCFNCASKKRSEKFIKLELVEWDGKSALQLWDTDKYFFSLSEIEDYIDEQNEDLDFEDISQNQPLTIEELKLVVSEETIFGEVNVSELFQDALHENWEYDKELQQKENEFNAFLRKHSTKTWMPTNKRVQL